MTNREEAMAALKQANPKWSEKHCRYAYEMMPSSTEHYYDKGTPQRAHAHATWLHHWTKWAIEMNILPDNTEIPPMPQGEAAAVSYRKRERDAASDVPRQPARSGVQAPRPGTAGDKIWRMLDQVKLTLGRIPTMPEVVEAAKLSGLNEGNSKTEFSAWKRYHSDQNF